MENPTPSPLRFVGVLGSELGRDAVKGDVFNIEYAGRTVEVRVTAAYDDYDDFGTAIPRYDLEAIGVGPG